MKNSKVLGYGIGSLGKDFALGVISSYLLVFYTDVLVKLMKESTYINLIIDKFTIFSKICLVC